MNLSAYTNTSLVACLSACLLEWRLTTLVFFKNGVLSSLPSVGEALSNLVAGQIADILRTRGLSTKNVRVLFQSICEWNTKNIYHQHYQGYLYHIFIASSWLVLTEKNILPTKHWLVVTIIVKINMELVHFSYTIIIWIIMFIGITGLGRLRFKILKIKKTRNNFHRFNGYSKDTC